MKYKRQYLYSMRIGAEFRPVWAGALENVVNEAMADKLSHFRPFIEHGYVWIEDIDDKNILFYRLIGKIDMIRQV